MALLKVYLSTPRNVNTSRMTKSFRCYYVSSRLLRLFELRDANYYLLGILNVYKVFGLIDSLCILQGQSLNIK